MAAMDRSAATDTLRHRPFLVAVAAVGTLVGLAVRTRLTGTPLWLDEAQTVAIARLSLGELFDALAQDGHPPLAYLWLHAWIEVFGDSDAAVRASAAVPGLGAIIAVAALARRLGGAIAAVAALALAATSPFLVRYATEVRMYALLTLLSVTWWLALRAAPSGPRRGWVLVGVLAALLLYTHYWSTFLLAAGGAWLLWDRRRDRPTVARAVVAHGVAALAFAPWVPTLLDQLERTGTPWATAPNPASAAVTALADLAGGRNHGAALGLLFVLGMLLLLGAAGRHAGPLRVELDLRGDPIVRPVLVVGAGTMALGLATITVTDTAFASRYVAVVAGFAVVVAALGVTRLDDVPAAVLLAVAVALGAAGSWKAVSDDRTQAAAVADAIAATADSDDVVVVCPDQLGPATARALHTRHPDVEVQVLAFPDLDDGRRVDWRDYARRHDRAEVEAVVTDVLDRADGAAVWLVWNEGYRTLDGKCRALHDSLAARRSTTEVLAPDRAVFEPMALTRYQPATP